MVEPAMRAMAEVRMKDCILMRWSCFGRLEVV
jgi:hypothetical protein